MERSEAIRKYIKEHGAEWISLIAEARETYRKHKSVSFNCESDKEVVDVFIDNSEKKHEASTSISAYMKDAARYAQEVSGKPVRWGITVEIRKQL